ncbi:MAG: C40 family peptidase, partial [Olsenella sp.]|nr:C40 family peptidase [Olsenella sp.]
EAPATAPDEATATAPEAAPAEDPTAAVPEEAAEAAPEEAAEAAPEAEGAEGATPEGPEGATAMAPEATDAATVVAPEAQDDAGPAEAPEAGSVGPAAEPSLMNVYRLYNPVTGEHFYTPSLYEARAITEGAGWRWEGVGWVSQRSGEPVYRLYNPHLGDHHYTRSAGERDALAAYGWSYEGVGWYSGGGRAVLREYDPRARTGAHNFTTSAYEHESLVGGGWRDEGTAWLSSSEAALPIEGFWLVSGSWGSLERYWVGADAAIARGRVVTPSEGAGYHAYATEGSGAVLRGARDLGNGTVMLADNDGRLATGSGFVTSGSYGAGDQLYYLQSTREGYSLARSGLFVVDDGHYWGQAATAAIMRGKMPKSDVLFVSNPKTGKLAWTVGWRVTDEYDTELQRYYFIESDLNGYIGARLGTFTEGGKRYYGRTDEGYVVRGTYVISQYEGVPAWGGSDHLHDDTVVIADNNGVLLTHAQVGELLVKAAQSQIGASYDEEGSAYHAAANPKDSSFNCSGFTWWVYSTLGLKISHNQGYYSYYTGESNLEDCQMWGVESRNAWKTKVEDLVPGDIVFFSPAHDKYRTGHVGIYIGDGKMIDANTTGVMVRSIMNGSKPKATFVGGGFPVTLVA